MTDDQFINLAKTAPEVPDHIKPSGHIFKLPSNDQLNEDVAKELQVSMPIPNSDSADVRFFDNPPSDQIFIVQIRNGKINKVIVNANTSYSKIINYENEPC